MLLDVTAGVNIQKEAWWYILECWKMSSGYCFEVIEGRREGQGEGFIGSKKKEPESAFTPHPLCYWVLTFVSSPPRPRKQALGEMHRNIRVVCQTTSGRFGQSEAPLARPGNNERPATTTPRLQSSFSFSLQRPSILLLEHVMASQRFIDSRTRRRRCIQCCY